MTAGHQRTSGEPEGFNRRSAIESERHLAALVEHRRQEMATLAALLLADRRAA